jgi:hypothetical protein
MSLTFGWPARVAAALGRPRPVGGSAVRTTAAVALAAFLLALIACSRGPQHPDWVIHSAIEIVGPPPRGGYRLLFPYIVGDLYGSANTGSFVVPVSLSPDTFTLDLNRTQEALESELGPADFELRFLRIAPHDARFARLTPVALQRNGIESVGTVEWLDAGSRTPLMLVYIDRPARIAGSFDHGGAAFRYDIRAAKPGYVWIGAIHAGGRDMLYTVVPPPQHLILTITMRPSGGSDEIQREKRK